MKGCYSDSWILYSVFFISLFRGLRFKPDAEIGPSMSLRVMSLSNELFGIFEMASNKFYTYIPYTTPFSTANLH